MFQSRTHTCNELRMEHVGQTVKLVGWMENVREVGSSLAFVILRDFYGTTQIVLETEDMMAAIKGLNKDCRHGGPAEVHQQGVHHLGRGCRP